MLDLRVVLYLDIPIKDLLLSFWITERTIGSVVVCRSGLVIASLGVSLAQYVLALGLLCCIHLILHKDTK